MQSSGLYSDLGTQFDDSDSSSDVDVSQIIVDHKLNL